MESGPRSLVLLLVLTAASCGRSHSEPAPELRCEPLDAPAGPRSRVPNVASGPNASTWLSWVETDETGLARLLTAPLNTNAEFGEPEEIARGDDWFLNWADFPAIAAGSEGVRLATWLARSGEGTYAYGVHVSVARGTAAWSAPEILHTDRSPSEHGFVSLAPLPGGAIAAVWLDGRSTAAAHGGGHGDGAMHLMTAVVAADGTRGAEVLLDERVCDCCQTSCVRTDDGQLVVAYRDRSDSEVRDISVVRGRPGGPFSEPRAVHADGWEFPGCPVNGPALATDGVRVALAWFTMGSDETPRTLVALSPDGGLTFGQPKRVDEGDGVGRVDCVFAEDGTLLVSWLESSGTEAAWRVRAFDPNLEPGPAATVAAVSPERASGFLRLAAHGQGAFAAWTDVLHERVRCARILPATP